MKTESDSPIVKAITSDKKLMNRLAWQVAWQMTLRLLPWLIGPAIGFLVGVEFALRSIPKP